LKSDPPQNRLLAALPAAESRRLIGLMEQVDLKIKQSLFEPNEPIHHVFFPLRGVSSMVAEMDDGDLVEIATIGNEGVVGIALFLGSVTSAMRAFQQIPGTALRMTARDFTRETNAGGPLPQLLRRYTQALFTQIAQSTGCNRLHPIEERCARWLLQTHDRVRSDDFPLTHEFLAQMLGVRRATVTVAMGALQRAGFVEYKHGVIRVLDRKSLERSSCECYRVIADEYDRLLNGNR
jgi:CRP-like cAMP-binding protein